MDGDGSTPRRYCAVPTETLPKSAPLALCYLLSFCLLLQVQCWCPDVAFCSHQSHLSQRICFGLCFTLGEAALCPYLSFSSLSDRLSDIDFRREEMELLRSIKEGLPHLHYYVKLYQVNHAPRVLTLRLALCTAPLGPFDIYYNCFTLSLEESEAASSISRHYLIFATGRTRITLV